MGPETSIGIDRIHKVPAEETIDDWVITDRHCRHRPYFMVWVAGENNKIKATINKTAQKFDVDEDSIVPIKISPENSNLYSQVFTMKEEIVKHKGEVIIVVATGYEKLIARISDKYRLTRAGHDWDQDMLEGCRTSDLGKFFLENGKHLVIITTIDNSEGQDNYEKAVKSAIQSQFKDGFLEIS